MAQYERLHYQERPWKQGDDNDYPVICVNLAHTLDELLKEYQERKFNGEDRGPDEGEECMNFCGGDF